MSKDLFDQIHEFDRVSIRAVLVTNGEAPDDALFKAGIFNSVAIPVVIGNDDSLSAGILGNGITPNVTAVLEPDPEDDFECLPPSQATSGPRHPVNRQPPEPKTDTLPSAYGLQPLAPVRSRNR